MFAYNTLINKNIGLSLIEVMLGTALSIFLLTILFNIYLTAERSLKFQKSFNNIQENAQLASYILKTEIHKAGYIGCSHLTEDFPIINYPPFTITAKNKLLGSTDEIKVRHADSAHVNLIQPMHRLDTIFTTRNVHFSPGDILIISDCKNAEIFKLKKIMKFHDGQQLIATFPLHVEFSSYAEISRLIINRYFISKSNFQDPNEKATKSLFVEDSFHRKSELVSGINKMQILYSIYQDGEMIDIPAREVFDWKKIVGVNIQLEIISNQFKKNWNLYVALES